MRQRITHYFIERIHKNDYDFGFATADGDIDANIVGVSASLLYLLSLLVVKLTIAMTRKEDWECSLVSILHTYCVAPKSGPARMTKPMILLE